ncbi:MAG: hypothetical protein A3J54_02560 [Candidatus Ryanbacteria bacterium RIFCSPHIGHO2_02_FULL_45_13b]|uniref:Uncharacterized protein n=1 Tax=Candidatus Ryanbacteria bacterium RIFCSPHIGHO2_02_FULL_45_13b TaxID=1802117 RepID=A0A1G2G762_9BACT|nr:MAG: hypothetical protein A3J54_02560 [Candidatus Ryanbacteria bacterium RIFCSPHIGHO2_02_FULL_45_13b]
MKQVKEKAVLREQNTTTHKTYSNSLAGQFVLWFFIHPIRMCPLQEGHGEQQGVLCMGDELGL